jgi:hypothetical protein
VLKRCSAGVREMMPPDRERRRNTLNVITEIMSQRESEKARNKRPARHAASRRKEFERLFDESSMNCGYRQEQADLY